MLHIMRSEYMYQYIMPINCYGVTSRIPLFDLGNNGLYDENATANFVLKHVLNNLEFRKSGERSPNCNRVFNIVNSWQQR